MKSKDLLIPVLAILCLFLLVKLYSRDQKLKQSADCTAYVEEATKRADSLEAELFPIQVEITRHQLAFEILAERNPKAAEQYATIISEETE